MPALSGTPGEQDPVFDPAVLQRQLDGPYAALRDRIREELCRPEQTYMSLWSHGANARKHLHVAVQPVTAAVVARYGGLRSEQLQARMLASGDEPAVADVERFCERARELFRTV